MQITDIVDSEAHLRLDQLLAKRFPERSRTYLQWLIEKGCVKLNGQVPKKRAKAQVGDVVAVEFVELPEIELTPEDIPLEVLYEDEHLIAVNKPAGMVVHPGAGNWNGTFVNALLFHCQGLDAEGLRPGIVHRLDKETSGVLVAAKSARVQQLLGDAFKERRVQKTYLAITMGNPGNMTIEAPIGRHPGDRKRMSIVEGGKPATTVCEVVGTDGKLALLRIDLKTGRMHQIRVHLQHHRTPVLGDSVYGSSSANRKYGVKRQMLHAERLVLEHPITGETLDIKAPLPEDMSQCVRYFNELNQLRSR